MNLRKFVSTGCGRFDDRRLDDKPLIDRRFADTGRTFRRHILDLSTTTLWTLRRQNMRECWIAKMIVNPVQMLAYVCVFYVIHVLLFETGVGWGVICIQSTVTWGYLIQMARTLCRLSVCHPRPLTGSSWFRAWGWPVGDFIFFRLNLRFKLKFRPKLKLYLKVRV